LQTLRRDRRFQRAEWPAAVTLHCPHC